MTINLRYQNNYTGDIYCGAECAVIHSMESAQGVMSDERFEEWTAGTLRSMSWEDNLAVLNAGITDADACGEVVVLDGPLAADTVWLCDRCFVGLS